MELDLFFDWRPDHVGWYWTKTGEGMGNHGPFVIAGLAVQSAEWLYPDLKWMVGVLEFYKAYL